MLFSAFLLVCIQGCLVQTVLSQCIRPYSAGPGPAAVLASPLTCDEALEMIAAPFATSVTLPFSESFLSQAAVDSFGAYGGVGFGMISAKGELPAEGTTALVGQIPILGAVEFGGIVPAAGKITIAGSCACGCVGTYI